MMRQFNKKRKIQKGEESAGFQSYQGENTFTMGNGIPGDRVVYPGRTENSCWTLNDRVSIPPGRGSSVPSRTRVGKEPCPNWITSSANQSLLTRSI